MNRNWKIDRRSFLRGAAGALLPLPFLNLMEAKSLIGTQSSGSSADSPPLRFMTLFKPNGVYPPSWNINGGTEFDFRMSPLMAPFAKHKEDLLILPPIMRGDGSRVLLHDPHHLQEFGRHSSNEPSHLQGPSLPPLLLPRPYEGSLHDLPIEHVEARGRRHRST